MSEYIVEELDGVEVRGHYVTSYVEHEEIVRCKDCVHHEISELGQSFCIWEHYTDWECEPDGFCRWGERKIELLTEREIVRCRDCRHFTAGDREYATCDWCDWWDSDTEADGFCAWGERGEA